MNLLHILNASGKLPPELAAELRQVMETALHRHAGTLELDGVDVAVRVLPWGLPETGIHGYAPAGHYVELTVNPQNTHFPDAWRTELPATLAHELHHTRRWQGVGYGQTLLEILVSEGLAQHYETLERDSPPPWAQAPANLDVLWNRASPLLNTTDFEFEAWFYGSPAENLPRWAGYALGRVRAGVRTRQALFHRERGRRRDAREHARRSLPQRLGAGVSLTARPARRPRGLPARSGR